jgi:hypothetical protein
MPELKLFPPIDGLSFDEAAHRYTFSHPKLGLLPMYSVSQVMEATDAKAMNWSHWRKRLMEKGLTEQEAAMSKEQGLTADPGVPLALDYANAFMEWWRSHRAAVGTCFHALTQAELLGQAMPDNPIEESVRMFGRWCEDFLPLVEEVYIVEQPLIHRSAFVAGTPDLYAKVGGVRVVVDWKTQLQKFSSAGAPLAPKIRPEWTMQNGAYSRMIESCYGKLPVGGANYVCWDGGSMLKTWNAADLDQGWRKFAGFLMELHARESALGSIPHTIAMQAMQPMFTGVPING